jgi:hypothetical protein
MLATGCAKAPLFVVNHDVRITTPSQMATVSAPVHVSWRTTKLPSTATQYLVFIDTPPIHPGQSVRAIASGDSSCIAAAGCPNAAYLAARDIFLTRQQSATIPFIAALNGIEGHDALPIHEVTVILIDRAGRRVGEYAYTTQFRVRPTGP